VFDSPTVAVRAISRALRERYGIDPATLDFAIKGQDPAAQTWIARTHDGRGFFLKLKPAMDRARLDITRYLADSGLERVVAPIPTSTGRLSVRVGGLELVVFPYIDGRPAIEGRLTDSQWLEYGRLVRAIHDARLPARLARGAARETFGGEAAAALLALDPAISGYDGPDPVSRDLAAAWHLRRTEILALVTRAEALRLEIRRRRPQPELVLCHSDVHVANVLVGTDGSLAVVDWDDLRFAPRERDLKFIVPGTIGSFVIEPGHTELFMRGYGSYRVDEELLRWYLDEWLVVDAAEYVHTAFVDTSAGPATRANAVDRFIRLGT
jgi:spectinomycin phosphotransferase